MTSVTFSPIGTIQVEEGNFYIQLDTDHYKATTGLDDYSHLQVAWWFNLTDTEDNRQIRLIEKPYVKGPEQVGIFASRSPIRPNPLAITPCQLLYLDDKNHRLYIAYIDAEPGTPVLDIKPYLPCIDRLKEATYPKWCKHWPAYYEKSATFPWEEEFNF